MHLSAPNVASGAIISLLMLCSASVVALEAEADHRNEPGASLPPLEVFIDKSRVDLERHRLEVTMSRAADRIELKVFGESGRLLAQVTERFQTKPARALLTVRWVPESDEPVAKIELFAYDTAGYYKAIRLVPWSVAIPHEEVVFETASAEVLPSEESKLEASLKLVQAALAKHQDLGPITLFIAGHTDTRGGGAYNLDLSRRRARAIASWFHAHGSKLAIAYEGFGESSLKVPTADEVDEQKNRRVDYVLSVDTPAFKTTGAVPAWKRL